MGCFSSKQIKHTPGYEDPVLLASETSFSIGEVEALYELFKKLSFSIIKDGLIHKEEFQFALFRNSNKKNLFADRIFDLFDLKRNGVIEFGEFVRSLSVFHPKTPESEKTAFAFRLYDLRHTGSIERVELKEMVLALLSESDLQLSDDIVEAIVDNTFKQADSNGDGKIDGEEWKDFVKRNPAILKNMTLPYLVVEGKLNHFGHVNLLIINSMHYQSIAVPLDITMSFPSFVVYSDTSDADMMN